MQGQWFNDVQQVISAGSTSCAFRCAEIDDVSWEFALVALLSGDTGWTGTFTVDRVAWSVLAAVTGFAAVRTVIPESLCALVALESDHVGSAFALSGDQIACCADGSGSAVASLTALAGVKVEVSGLATVAVVSYDVVLAGTEAKLVVTSVRSASGAFTLGAVSGNDSVPIETIGASFAVLAAGVEHTVVAFTSVRVAGFQDDVWIQVAMAVAHLAASANDSGVAKVTVGALVTIVSSVSHLAVAHQVSINNLAGVGMVVF